MSEAADNTGAATPCAGCAARDRRIAELEARVAAVEAKLGEAARAGKRQAAPFSNGPPKADPKPPGRKGGEGIDSLHFLSSTIKARLGHQPQLLIPAPAVLDTG